MKLIAKILVFILSTLAVGCSDNSEPKEQYINNDRPGDTATVYFDALYNHNDLQRASRFATPKLARIMTSYGTAKQFTRSLVNLQYDEVSIEIDMTHSSLRKQYGDKARINIIFSGYHNNEKIDQMRSINMLKISGKWYVDKIIADPYTRY